MRNELVRKYNLKQVNLMRRRASIFFETNQKKALNYLRVANDATVQDITHGFTYRSLATPIESFSSRELSLYQRWTNPIGD